MTQRNNPLPTAHLPSMHGGRGVSGGLRMTPIASITTTTSITTTGTGTSRPGCDRA
ncbi:hypothetical protein [Marilutibacter alkalisoli]|uniref:hypothetical protein n=1 Tax=Marilutibacter alkalisoli TaxID=2591633 RepID=UPI001421D516|nr:hypothetical protein [Lysobacter alkalisoli]